MNKIILITLSAFSMLCHLNFNTANKEKSLYNAAYFIDTSTVTFLGSDKSTQGHWEGKYGSNGYMLFGYAPDAASVFWEHKITDLKILPAYLTDYNLNWGGGYWPDNNINNGDPAILDKPAVLPPGANSDKFIVYASRDDQSFITDYTFTLNDHATHIFSFYTNTTASAGPTIKVDLLDLNNQLLNTRQIDINTFNGGGYVSYAIKGSFRLKIQTQPGWGVEGLFFDSLSSATATGLSAVYDSVSNQVHLNWANSGTPDNILIERSTDNSNFDQIAKISGGSNSFTDSLINNGLQYFYRIRYQQGTKYGAATAVAGVTVPAFIQTIITPQTGNLSVNVNGTVTLSAKLEQVSNGITTAIAGKTILFKLRGNYVGDGTSLGQEIPSAIGSAITDINGIASISYSASYTGNFTVLDSFSTDPADKLNGSSATIQLNVKSPWTTAPKFIKISDAVSPERAFTINASGIDTAHADIAIFPDYAGQSPDTPVSGAIHPAILQKDANGNFIAARMPKGSAAAVYNVWIKNSNGWSKPGKMNIARPLFISEYQAAAGNEIELVGRNFDQKEFGGATMTLVRLNNGNGYTSNRPVSNLNPYHVSFSIDESVSLGNYFIEVSNDNGVHWSRLNNGQTLTIVSPGSDPLRLGVSWAGDFKWNDRFNVRAYGADGTDSADDTQAAQAAIDAAEQAGGGTVYFPNGNYYISNVNIGAGVVLLGQDQYNTRLYYTAADGRIFLNSKGHNSLGGIPQLQGVARLSLLLTDSMKRPDSYIWLGDPWGENGNDNFGNKVFRTANRLFCNRVNIDYPAGNAGAPGTGRGMAFEFIAKERVMMKGNRFHGWGATNTITAVSEYVIIRDNDIEFSTGYVHCMSSYSFFENNKVVIHPESNHDSHGLFARTNSYMADNQITGAGTADNSTNDGEGISNEGPGGAFNYGQILKADSSSLTVSPKAALVSNPPLQYGDLSVFITNGRGLGQLRKVTAIDPNTKIITVDRPFDIIPDSASGFALVTPLENFTVYRNTLTNCAKGIWPFGFQYDCLVANNTTVNSQGIFEWAVRNDQNGLGEYIPDYFSRFTRNTITGVSRRDNFGGISLYAARFGSPGFTGVQVYSAEIINNTITGNNTLPTGASGTESPPYSGICAVAYGYSNQSDGTGTGDISNLIIEGNKLSNLKTGITLTKSDYGSIVTNNKYDCSVLKFFNALGGDMTLFSGNTNTGLIPFTITSPGNNSTAGYVNGRLEIKTTPSVCTDSLFKLIFVSGPGLDTLIITDGATETIYLDSSRLIPDRWYRINGKLTDKTDTINASAVVRFKTPGSLAAAMSIYPNPAADMVYINTPKTLEGAWNIQLAGIDGKQLFAGTRMLSQGSMPFDLSNYKTGVYIVILTQRSKRYTYKLVINKSGTGKPVK